VENSRECNGLINRYGTEFCIRHDAGIGTQAKYRCVLTRGHLCECGAVREVLMDNLSQLGVREAEPPAPDRCHNSDGGALERIATRTRGKRGTYAAE
jgi:hypothetical protein